MTTWPDETRIAAWLDQIGLEPGLPLRVTPITAGKSNLMYRIERGPRRWVLRRPAGVAVDRADEGMRREFRLLTALTKTAVPHPTPVALCTDPTVFGRVFYLMEAVDGYSPMPPLPPFAAAPGYPARAMAAMIDALATLHRVDPMALGLNDFGRPDGFHERQVRRWGNQLASYGDHDLHVLREIGPWLEARAPSAWTPGLMHGDYHMLNLLLEGDENPRVTAILDWETATIGDPLLDVAGFLEVSRLVYPSEEGWPGEAEILARYDPELVLGDLTYYRVLYNYRLAVLMGGIHIRSLRDPDRADAADVGERAVHAARRARDLSR
ncbi:phosphotransferase family protein [Nocardia sp. CA-136227]|uniref:phosphotransferase family protein n=1 Tax=Nocardia sp. CA-136227 TaxID=3239979 RepID=UPI003D9868B9